MIRVFLVCSGLGHIRRGYESFTQECFEALSTHPSLQMTLFQGGKPSTGGAVHLWNLPRNHPATQALARGFGQRSHVRDPYFLEQASFGLSLIPYLMLQQPDVVFFSDFALGTLLWHWRRVSRLPYKLLFSNGAPNGPPFSRMDHVQHLTPLQHQQALETGDPPEKHSLIPYGIKLSQDYHPLPQPERDALRRTLNLPVARPIVLSVGAINRSHKRMDYVIREIARLPEPRPYLVLLGQPDPETPDVVNLAHRVLGDANFRIGTVSAEEINQYYQTADVFVLASLREGFGRVFLEAMAHGLPCLAHAYEGTQFILGQEFGVPFLDDFEVEGHLAQLIPQALLDSQVMEKCQQRHQFIYQRFSWQSLQQRYVTMIQQCVADRRQVCQ